MHEKIGNMVLCMLPLNQGDLWINNKASSTLSFLELFNVFGDSNYQFHNLPAPMDIFFDCLWSKMVGKIRRQQLIHIWTQTVCHAQNTSSLSELVLSCGRPAPAPGSSGTRSPPQPPPTASSIVGQ